MHTILFTGHMIDKTDREVTRFPAVKENAVKAAIKKELVQQLEMYNSKLSGIAGGASGGDILFHELCKELGIPSKIFLALPEDDYKKASVSFAGKTWERRFEELVNINPVRVLANEKTAKVSIWERTNMWMLKEALIEGGENLTLMALWDCEGGDGEGG